MRGLMFLWTLTNGIIDAMADVEAAVGDAQDPSPPASSHAHADAEASSGDRGEPPTLLPWPHQLRRWIDLHLGWALRLLPVMMAFVSICALCPNQPLDHANWQYD